MIITGKTIQKVIELGDTLILQFTDNTSLEVRLSTGILVVDTYSNGQYQGTVTDETEAE